MILAVIFTFQVNTFIFNIFSLSYVNSIFSIFSLFSLSLSLSLLDSNRVSDYKKSNVVLVCGSPTGVEQARCKIRTLLPMVVHFKLPLDCLKPNALENYSKITRNIQQAYNVHISIRNSNEIDETHIAVFESSKSNTNYIAISVRGANNELLKLKESLNCLIKGLTECNVNFSIIYALTIEITEFYHQLVMGTNFTNIKSIMQQTGCCITFPELDNSQRQLDFDNLNEIPVNKSTVIIKGPTFESVHKAWKELIGYLPLVLTFDVAHDQLIDTVLMNQLKKQYKVAIFQKHKEKYNTVIIRGIEKNSKALFEVRKQLLNLEDAEIPICCNLHSPLLNVNKLMGHLNENGNPTNENTLNILSNLILNNQQNLALKNLNLLNGNAANVLNAKMVQIDTNNNLPNLNEKNHHHHLNNFANTNDIQQHQINPMVFHAALQEQNALLLKQFNQQQLSKHSSIQQQNSMNLFQNNGNPQLNYLTNANVNDEIAKLLKQQQGFIDSTLRTHSVNDITALQTSPSIFQNDALNHAIKKDHLTSSCSSPALHAMALQHNNSNSSMLNNFSMNNSNLNSTGNNNTSGSSATESTANNSFCSNGLNSSPPRSNGINSSLNSLINNSNIFSSNNSHSPIQAIQTIQANGINWPIVDQRNKQLAYDECKYLALKNIYEKPGINEIKTPSSVWSGYGFSKSMSHDTLKCKLNEWNPMMINSPPSQTNLNNLNCIKSSNINSNSNGLALEDSNAIKVNDETNNFTWSNMINNQTAVPGNNKQRALIKQESEICSSSHPYTSRYLENLISNDAQQQQFGTTNNSINDLQLTANQAIVQQFNNANLNGAASDRFDFIDVNKIDLATVLFEYGLAKYIELFKKCKIDFARFLSLTDDDLNELGIYFNGRRKLCDAIVQLRRLLQSNFIGNNYEKSSDEKQEDELTIAINRELKSLSSNFVIEPTDNQSANNSNHSTPNKISQNEVGDVLNAFDTFKLSNDNCDIAKDYSTTNCLTTTKLNANEKFDLNGDNLKKVKDDEEEEQEQEANSNKSIGGNYSSEESVKLNSLKDADSSSADNDENCLNQSKNLHNQDQNLVQPTVQEAAQA